MLAGAGDDSLEVRIANEPLTQAPQGREEPAGKSEDEERKRVGKHAGGGAARQAREWRRPCGTPALTSLLRPPIQGSGQDPQDPDSAISVFLLPCAECPAVWGGRARRRGAGEAVLTKPGRGVCVLAGGSEDGAREAGNPTTKLCKGVL